MLHTINSAANKSWSMVHYWQSSAFDCPYLSWNDHCDWWLFQEIFLILLLFPKNSFEWSWTLNSLNLITFTKHTEKVCFLLYLFIFYLLFCNHSVVLTLFIFCYFYTACKHTDESILFLLVVLQSLCILMLSTFCTFRIISSTKKNIKSFNLTSNTFCCEI